MCSLSCVYFCRFCVGIRVKRRSALGAMELGRLDIDIAALSEVRFAEQGSLGEDGAGYTFFWSGKNEDERRLSGVGFTIKTSIARKLQNLPVCHSNRIMSLRLPIQNNKFATVLSVYAPTLQAETGVKEAFCRDLHNLLQRRLQRLTPYLRRLQRKSRTRLRTVERSPR